MQIKWINTKCSRMVSLYAANKMLIRLAAPAHLPQRASRVRYDVDRRVSKKSVNKSGPVLLQSSLLKFPAISSSSIVLFY